MSKNDHRNPEDSLYWRPIKSMSVLKVLHPSLTANQIRICVKKRDRVLANKTDEEQELYLFGLIAFQAFIKISASRLKAMEDSKILLDSFEDSTDSQKEDVKLRIQMEGSIIRIDLEDSDSDPQKADDEVVDFDALARVMFQVQILGSKLDDLEDSLKFLDSFEDSDPQKAEDEVVDSLEDSTDPQKAEAEGDVALHIFITFLKKDLAVYQLEKLLDAASRDHLEGTE